jgi:four helix bundle protein
MKAYRLALFLSDISWFDITKLMRDRRTMGVADQLYRAVGSIGANLAEGYYHCTGPNRARLYEYALRSSRESRDWYHKSKQILGDAVLEHRFELLTDIIRLLLVTIAQQRGRTLRDSGASYSLTMSSSPQRLDESPSPILSRDVPLPE